MIMEIFSSPLLDQQPFIVFMCSVLIIFNNVCHCNPIQSSSSTTVKDQRSDRVGGDDHQQQAPNLETSSSVTIFLNRTKYPTIFSSSSSRSPSAPSSSSNGNTNNGAFSWSVGGPSSSSSSGPGHRWRVPSSTTTTTSYNNNPFSIHTSSQTPPSIGSRIYFPNDPLINFKTTIYPGLSTSTLGPRHGPNSYDNDDDPDVTGGPKEITKYNNFGVPNDASSFGPPSFGSTPSTGAINFSINPSTTDDDSDDDYTETPPAVNGIDANNLKDKNGNNNINKQKTFNSNSSTPSFASSHSSFDGARDKEGDRSVSSISTSSVYRPQILVPDIDPNSGKPSCVTSNMETFCESVNNYPKVDLKKDIKMSMSDFREIFGSESIEGRKTYQDDDDIVEERVCKRIPKVVYPQMARNQANQWVYIVNDVEYVQAVVSEICQNEGNACNYMDNLPDGTYSRCRQKYSYKKLLAIHPTEQRTYTDTFAFPSCCACYVKGPGLRLKR